MSYFYDLAREIASGHLLTTLEIDRLLKVPYTGTDSLFPGASLLRKKYFGRRISICRITNAKSGQCFENCSFCAQSVHHASPVEDYPLKPSGELADIGKASAQPGIKSFSMVTSGRGLSPGEVQTVSQALRELAGHDLMNCASLGILGRSELDLLKKSGLDRYHHNLETAPSFFPSICTTHEISDRIKVVADARDAGLSVCSGGVFGMGETDAQVVELALVLKKLNVDAVPVNFLVPVSGTPLENYSGPSPLRCLKIICLLRYLLPGKEIIICGGRMENLRELHPFIFMAGASGIMTGDYLTIKGRRLEEDLKLINDLGLEAG